MRTQAEKLSAVKGFFRWLAKNGYLLANPASELELPKIPPRRPPEVFTVAEVEQIPAQPDLSTACGVRGRAILETLYSTGMRRKELSKLAVSDIHVEAGILRVRHGKGRRNGSSRSAHAPSRGSIATSSRRGPSWRRRPTTGRSS